MHKDAICFNAQLALHHAVEQVIALGKACAKYQEIARQHCAILQFHMFGVQLLDAALDRLDLPLLQHVAEVVVQDLPATEHVDLDWGLWEQVPRQAELHAEHELYDTPPSPLDWRQDGMQVPSEARDIEVSGQHEVAEPGVRAPLEGHEVAQVTGDGPMRRTEDQGAGLAMVRTRHSVVHGRLTAAYDHDVLSLADLRVEEVRRVVDVSFEAVPPSDTWDVRRPPVHASGNDDKVKVLLLRGLALTASKDVPSDAVLADLNARDACVKADHVVQAKTLAIELDVALHLRARRELVPIRTRRVWELGELVKFFWHLQAKGVVVRFPDSPDIVGLLKDDHLLATPGKGPRGLEARNPAADHGHPLHVVEVIPAQVDEALFQPFGQVLVPLRGGVQKGLDTVNEFLLADDAPFQRVHDLKGAALESGLSERFQLWVLLAQGQASRLEGRARLDAWDAAHARGVLIENGLGHLVWRALVHRLGLCHVLVNVVGEVAAAGDWDCSSTSPQASLPSMHGM
mmetsp:Transcript_10005/g.24956  ORF Transcript_10005/g.24956 Transcript_10005/m.24956 type:complete len:514 (+) Transcript_10005:497-2038(+)